MADTPKASASKASHAPKPTRRKESVKAKAAAQPTGRKNTAPSDTSSITAPLKSALKSVTKTGVMEPVGTAVPNASKDARASRKKKGRAKLSLPTVSLPKLWRRARMQARRSGSTGVRGALKSVVVFLILLVGALGTTLGALVRQSLAAKVVAGFAVVLVCVIVVDVATTSGRAYAGVHIGSIDASGKTAQELEQLITETYGSKLQDETVVVYASEEARATVDADMAAAQDAALAEQLAVEEFRANKQAWIVAAEDVGAVVDAQKLAQAALAVGREDGGILARMGAALGGCEIAPEITYNSAYLEALALDIDATIGEVRQDYDVEVVNGYASVVAGHDGDMVNRDSFRDKLTEGFFSEGDEQSASFVAEVEYAPLRITEQDAQAVADLINERIADGATFDYDGSSWHATPLDLGAWISTTVEPRDDGWALKAFVDAGKARPSLLIHMEGEGKPPAVTFSVQGDEVTVNTKEAASIPLVAAAVSELQSRLFGEAAGTALAQGPIEVKQGTAPTAMSLSEALDYGIVAQISSYTTEFTTGTGTENRNHNIELVSSLLNNSVVGPHQTWSFNATAGDCNEAAGFEEAGAIVGGEYVDSTGGGICQVATTVFNAVYEAGLPVPNRRNHSLYISSYPAGRDAAVSWPDLDLQWENETDSDMLLQVECIDGSVTATLFGTDPGYIVTSETGAWEKGDEYETVVKIDETLGEGASYIKTAGADGSEISVVRTVTDEEGNVVRQDTFLSVYSPIDEVVVKGSASTETDSESYYEDPYATDVYTDYNYGNIYTDYDYAEQTY